MIRYIIFVVTILPIFSFAQFEIKGKILNLRDIENLNISLNVGMTINRNFNATIAKDSTFFITGKLDEPINGMLSFENGRESKSFKILLENESTYQVEVDLGSGDSLVDNSWYQIQTGSSYHNTWSEFYQVQHDLILKIKQVESDFENNTISKEILDKKLSNLSFEINQKFRDLAVQKPGNYAVAYILNGAPDLSLAYLPYYEQLEENVKNSYWGKKLNDTFKKFYSQGYQYEQKSSILGAQFKSIQGRGILENKIESFESNNLNSKLTLIDFWASWCAPCRLENFKLAVLNDYFDEGDFRIISFSLDNDLNKWKEATIEDDISWVNISDLKGVKSTAMADFQIKQLPRNILVNSKGEIIAVDKFGDSLMEYIEDFLKKI
ncbi:redoxin domain-containing protein [Subsaximicrobium wynnwilliamsii]|uniref:Redoxin domain-containing protein n=1 Tax=Subsaximicrobium wynnwilliamsii TaxID=291179 RepID=A0A5C6ZET1_9FLAO|nr:TlpA disulfide reductase family protein [Subsaximicrobium wynnwilliamsii]TXD82437.1 redoxin domain-containing protein [Subsaximicrobium wynnwilliamsii]TXD88079.1 redoxin domain-containing protein [Subsaximicrobium wynnwilliamsii]TXE02059.1 redoxin domain-containing protein [Subsaximicrobium wynnwilliamsii]